MGATAQNMFLQIRRPRFRRISRPMSGLKPSSPVTLKPSVPVRGMNVSPEPKKNARPKYLPCPGSRNPGPDRLFPQQRACRNRRCRVGSPCAHSHIPPRPKLPLSSPRAKAICWHIMPSDSLPGCAWPNSTGSTGAMLTLLAGMSMSPLKMQRPGPAASSRSWILSAHGSRRGKGQDHRDGRGVAFSTIAFSVPITPSSVCFVIHDISPCSIIVVVFPVARRRRERALFLYSPGRERLQRSSVRKMRRSARPRSMSRRS